MEKLIGKILDNRYEVLEVIGTGGMAIVYKAKCHRLNRYVALKVMKEEIAQDEEFRRRFFEESQAVAMLSHPNIVGVYDVSRSSEIEYIVMELIDGITLKDYLSRRGALSWKETTFFAVQIAKALEHAHSRDHGACKTLVGASGWKFDSKAIDLSRFDSHQICTSSVLKDKMRSSPAARKTFIGCGWVLTMAKPLSSRRAAR